MNKTTILLADSGTIVWHEPLPPHAITVESSPTFGVAIGVNQKTGEELWLEYNNGRLVLRHYDNRDDENPKVIWAKTVREQE